MTLGWHKLRGTVGAAFILTFAAIGILAFSFYHSERQQQVVEQLELFDRLRAAVTHQTAGPETSNANISGKYFHSGQTPDLVAAGILTQLKEIASAQGIEIIRSGNVPAESKEGIDWVAVNIEISAPEAAIYRFVRDVELTIPALYVAKLQMRSNLAVGVVEASETPLTVELTVNGAVSSVPSD
jgi:Type II secretion system (T2SS), protein M subtype b